MRHAIGMNKKAVPPHERAGFRLAGGVLFFALLKKIVILTCADTNRGAIKPTDELMRNQMIRKLFFETAPALSAIFQLGFEPKEEYFYELTAEQYQQLGAQGEDITETWYMILPEESKHLTDEAVIVNERQKNDLLEAAKVIENYCNQSGKKFNDYEEKLEYVSSLLPPVFTKDSKFKRNRLKLVVSRKSE
jgi:hypothetical protein